MRRTGQGPTGSPGPGSQRFGTQDQDQARQGCMLLSVRPRCPPLWPVIVVLPNWPAAGLVLSPPWVLCIHCPIKGARHRAALSRFFGHICTLGSVICPNKLLGQLGYVPR